MTSFTSQKTRLFGWFIACLTSSAVPLKTVLNIVSIQTVLWMASYIFDQEVRVEREDFHFDILF